MNDLFSVDLLKLAAYVIVFVPGFIYVQTIEHHLLRERKPQFEKTLEIVLSSAIIWTVALSLPFWWPASESRDRISEFIINRLNNRIRLEGFSEGVGRLGSDAPNVFFSVCVWTFVLSNVIGYVRKEKHVDALIKFVTGRDWYPSVAFRFFKENINKGVEVTLEGKRYLGILYSAPDNKDDKYIIIVKPLLIDEKTNTIERLGNTKQVVIRIEDIKDMKSFSSDILKEDRQS